MIEYPQAIPMCDFLSAPRNVMLLNNALGFLLGGGAYSHSSETDAQGVVISGWLPLCNNGVQRLADQKAHCFMNIWLDKLTWEGSLSFSIVPGPFEGGKGWLKGMFLLEGKKAEDSDISGTNFTSSGEVGFCESAC